jgi:hypothetical protein
MKKNKIIKDTARYDTKARRARTRHGPARRARTRHGPARHEFRTLGMTSIFLLKKSWLDKQFRLAVVVSLGNKRLYVSNYNVNNPYFSLLLIFKYLILLFLNTFLT